LRGKRSGDAVYIAIQDTGIGIPRAALEKLGRPFEQGREPAYQDPPWLGALASPSPNPWWNCMVAPCASPPSSASGHHRGARLPIAGPRRDKLEVTRAA